METTRTTGSTGTLFPAASALMTVVGFCERLSAPIADIPQPPPPTDSIPASLPGLVSVEHAPPATEEMNTSSTDVLEALGSMQESMDYI